MTEAGSRAEAVTQETSYLREGGSSHVVTEGLLMGEEDVNEDTR